MPTFYLPTLTLFLYGESWNSHKNIIKDCRVSEVFFFCACNDIKSFQIISAKIQRINQLESDSAHTEIRNAHRALVE